MSPLTPKESGFCLFVFNCYVDFMQKEKLISKLEKSTPKFIRLVFEV